MTKCVGTDCGTDLADDAKFCGSCGTAAATPMTKCSQGHDNGTEHKFCGQCGEPMVKALDEEFTAGLDDLVEMTKSEPAADRFVLPEVAGEEDVELNVEEMLKSEDLGLPEGTSVLDAGAMVKAVVAATHGRDESSRAALQAIGDELLVQRRRQDALIKGTASLMQSIKALQEGRLADLEEAVATVGKTRNPRKSVITPLTKSLATGDPTEERESPCGHELMQAALKAEGMGLIKSMELSVIEEMSNKGMNLDQVAQMAPRFGQALTRALSDGQAAN